MIAMAGVDGEQRSTSRWVKGTSGWSLCSLPHRRTGSNLSPQDPVLEIHAGNLGLTKLVPALHSRAMLPVWFLMASLGHFFMD